MSLRSQNLQEQVLALALIALGVLFRLLPHPENFTPTLAIALFAGVTLPPALALTVPLAVMIATDIIIGPHPLFWLVWACFSAMVLLGAFVRERAGVQQVAGAALLGSTVFFLLTNLGVFLFEGMYPKNWGGLVQCYTMALPFFRNSLAGDLSYTFCLFTLFAAAKAGMRKLKITA